MQGSSKGGARFRELDAFRGLAALSVVLFHYTGHANRYFGDLPWLFSHGDKGVQLFFMISGFVIFFTLERTRNWYDFAFNRFARLYPVYWAVILLSVATNLLAGRPIWWSAVVANASMVHSFFGFPDIDIVFWSLAVELVFYAIMVVLFVTGCLARIELVCVVWLAAALLWSAVGGYVDVPLHDLLGKILIFPYAPYFLSGIAFYRIRTGGTDRGNAGILALSLAAILFLHGWFDAAVALFFFVAFYLAVTERLTVLTHPALLWLGLISYSLYLVHRNLGYEILFWFNGIGVPSAVSVSLTVVIAIAVASLLTVVVEQPSLRFLRARYANFRVRSEAGQAPAPLP